MTWMGHVIPMETINRHTILTVNSKLKILLGRSGHRWDDDNIINGS
jgi:hypothetical protein